MRAVPDLARLAVGPVIAACVAGAQLVPLLELTRLGIRSEGLDFADAAAFSLPPPDLLVGLLPTTGPSPSSTEWYGWVGLGALLLALDGLRRRPRREAWWLAGLALIGLVLALGQYTPLYRPAFDLVPGLRLFRVPARWLTLWTLGVGLLAGWGLDSLGVAPLRGGGGRGWGALAASLALLALLVIAGLAYHFRHVIVWPDAGTLALWAGVAGATALAVAGARRKARLARAGMLGVVVAELAVASLHLPIHDAVWPDAVETRRPALDHLLATGTNERILALGDNSFDPGDLANLRTMLGASLPPSARDAYLTAIKHVEGQTPNLPLTFGLRALDGYDGGVLPLERFNLLKRLFPVQGKVVPDGRLQLQLVWAPDPPLLGWLDVRYLLMDRLRDRWIDGVYYDLGVSQPLRPGDSTALAIQPAFPSTAVGLIVATSGTPPDGPLRLASGSATSTLFLTGTPGGSIVGTEEDRSLWLYRVPFRQSTDSALTVSWQGRAPITLRSLSLIDERTGASQPVVVDPHYRLDFLGDLKIYADQAARPRAFLATGLQAVPDADAAVATMRQPGWSADTAVSFELPTGVSGFAAAGDSGTATIVDDEPERVVVQTGAPGRRVLVLTDSFYPGWHATIDGRDATILPVDLLFRGVVLPPGPHRVVFAYQPASWSVGLALSALGLIGLAAGLALARR